MFGADLTFPDLEADNYPLMYNVEGNKLILVDSSNCQRYKQIEDDVEMSNEWRTFFNVNMGEDNLEPKVYDWLIAAT